MTSVVNYEQPQPLPPSRPGDETLPGPTGDVARLRAAAEYAGYIADTEFVPNDLRGRPAAIAAAILYGAEIGLTPMMSLRSVVLIRGRPSLYAETQRGLIAAAGHEIWVEESTVTRAILAGRRQGSERIGRATITMDDAKRAGLAGQENYRRYPAAMLVARASAALAKQMFADVIGGMPAAEELEGEPDNGAPTIPAEPPPADAPTKPKSRTPRQRTTRAAVTPTPPPDPQPAPPAEPPDPATQPLATDAQKRQMFALMRDTGLTAGQGDRDQRLAYTIQLIGRPISSSNELTIQEAGLVIDDLKAIMQAIMQLPPEQRLERFATDAETAVLEQLTHELDATEIKPPPQEEPPPDNIPF
jgi:hypothetical protein